MNVGNYTLACIYLFLNEKKVSKPKKALQHKEFCNRGRGLSAASLRRLQATPPLQISLLQRP